MGLGVDGAGRVVVGMAIVGDGVIVTGGLGFRAAQAISTTAAGAMSARIRWLTATGGPPRIEAIRRRHR
jgi:hypothetical protein